MDEEEKNHMITRFPISEQRATAIQSFEKITGEDFPTLKTLFAEGCYRPQPYVAIIKIIQELVTIINKKVLPVIEGKHAIFTIGKTGAGKSTFGNWLLGCSVNAVANEEDSDDDTYSVQTKDTGFSFKVGHSHKHSETFLPNVKYLDKNTVLVDYPGFFDSYGFHLRIAMDIAFRQLLSSVKSMKIILLIPIGSFTDGRGITAKRDLDKIKRLLPTLNSKINNKDRCGLQTCFRWAIGITKCSKQFIKGSKQKYAEALEIISLFDQNLTQWVFNINKCCLFPNKKKKYYTPSTFIRALPSGPTKLVSSDILDSADIGSFTKEINCTMMKQDALKAVLGSCKEVFQNLDDLKKEMEGSCSGKIWGNLSKRMTEAVNRMAHFTEKMKEYSNELKDSGTLILEKVFPFVEVTCSYDQPKIKKAYLTVEEQLVEELMAVYRDFIINNIEYVKAMHDKEYIRSVDWNNYCSTYKEVNKTMKHTVADLGYDDIKDIGEFIFGPTGLLGTIADIFLCKAGALLEADNPAGAVLLVLGGFVYIGYILCKKFGDKKSKEIIDKCRKYLENCRNGFVAAAVQLKMTTKIRNELSRRIIIEDI